MTDLLLSWPDPAADWTEAMPVGNGRLGAMVFGGAGRTRIQVNDATVWSGFGSGYGYVPLVLPFIGLWWLHRHRPTAWAQRR